MATAPDLATLTVRYDTQRLTLHVPKTAKVGDILGKAAETLNVPPEELTLLYQGSELPDDTPIKDALQGKVTVLHLIKVVRKHPKPVTSQFSLPGGAERLYGFCRTCEGLVAARPAFTCRHCNTKNKFQRSSSEPLDYHADSMSPDDLVGYCSHCGKDGVQPIVQFDCTNCDESVALLRLFRSNKERKIPCMKCGLRKDVVMKFPCISGHCLCLDCFTLMCKQGLPVGNFCNFEGIGYSICCPGPGDDCGDSPVLDPHHFQVVGYPEFYEEFKEKSVQNYQPGGDNIFCKCKTEINISQGREVPVEEPAGATVTVAGLRWYHKLFKTQPKKPSPKTRRRTSCSQCSTLYCVECKNVWHEGDCVKHTKEIEEQEKAYPIDPAKARDGRWPGK